MRCDRTILLALMAIATITSSSLAADPPPTAAPKLPAKQRFHLFLLAGQSNMAGRGTVTKQDKVPHPRVLAMGKDGQWKLAVDPIHFDKRSAGVGLARSFANLLVERDESMTVGLIPAACGGSPISTWQPGGYHGQTKSHPYDDAIKRARLAMKHGTLKGILWHQGESDSTPKAAREHRAKLQALIERFRKDLNTPTLPFVIGQLGQFPKRPWSEHRRAVDQAHQSVAGTMKHVSFVSSDKLTPKKDNTHFDSKSLKLFGKRYATAYLSLVAKLEK